MKDDKKETGEELLDIDEKGNPIEKENEEKKTKPNKTYKYIISIILCFIILISCFYFSQIKKITKLSLM